MSKKKPIVCLGKQPKQTNDLIPKFKQALRWGLYELHNPLPPPPSAVNWAKDIGYWGMMRNDELGDCTIAALGHAIQIWTLNAKKSMATVSDDAIVTMYKTITGGRDIGAVVTTVLSYWSLNPLEGHRLSGCAEIDTTNTLEVKTAINLFGGVYVGVQLPVSCELQQIWDVEPETKKPSKAYRPGSWGGHAIYVVGYDDKHVTCITWGTPQKMTWEFWHMYVDEAYVLVSEDWIEPDGDTIQGITLDMLLEDMHQLQKHARKGPLGADDLILKSLPDGRHWEIMQDIVCSIKDHEITVPTGFVTDMASVPQLFWNIIPPNGSYSLPAVLHDYLYSNGALEKAECDSILLEAMKERGTSWFWRYAIYLAVKIGGGPAWNSHRAHDNWVDPNGEAGPGKINEYHIKDYF